MGDAAKHAALLIALGGKPVKGGPPEDHEEKKDDDLESAAVDDMFDAIKSSDRASFKDAVSRYVQACVTKATSDEDEEAPESGDYKAD